MIVAITGKKGSGKDSLAQAMLPLGFAQHRFADPLKAMLFTYLQMHGVPSTLIARMIDGDLKEVPSEYFMGKTPRHAMQTLGTEWRDTLSKDLWLHALEIRLRGYPGASLLTDCRFLHEAVFIRERGGVVVKIMRSEDGRTDEGKQHISETEMEGIVPDVEVFNYGSIEDLVALAPFVVESVKRMHI